MKRILTAGLAACLIFASGCTHPEIVSEQPIDCDYIPEYTQTIIVGKTPQVIVHPETFMVEYRYTYSDGSISTRWKEVSEIEYDRVSDMLDY